MRVLSSSEEEDENQDKFNKHVDQLWKNKLMFQNNQKWLQERCECDPRTLMLPFSCTIDCNTYVDIGYDTDFHSGQLLLTPKAKLFLEDNVAIMMDAIMLANFFIKIREFPNFINIGNGEDYDPLIEDRNLFTITERPAYDESYYDFCVHDLEDPTDHFKFVLTHDQILRLLSLEKMIFVQFKRLAIERNEIKSEISNLLYQIEMHTESPFYEDFKIKAMNYLYKIAGKDNNKIAAELAVNYFDFLYDYIVYMANYEN